MVNFTILAGGDTNDSCLTYLDQYTTDANSSWIMSHLTNKVAIALSATNQHAPVGALQSFAVDPEGAISLVDGIATGTEGKLEPHMTYQHHNELFIPDKGNGKIWRLGEADDNPGALVVHGWIQQPIGSGPRHHPTPTLQEVPAFPNGTFQVIASPNPYIYTSNRNTGMQDPRGDTIAIFENIGNQVYTGLDQIRGMMSGEQAGYGGDAYIVVAGGANLEEVSVNTAIPARTAFVWLHQNRV
ncbi:hypothetical protein PAXRUDRAFT_31049 [Paxillus rubicundulus Ve08.2h10]|uniref:Uncharacterized protein n=1 Tax=Paxillus rubicundulus Ve08.2h10 TaxID=930991 RepID=A0A0D0E384_9AGAM|nr:hypothetical protein PAXRUDRAFT_31049 [Paxillus rubicundulus Ve08.2h10]